MSRAAPLVAPELRPSPRKGRRRRLGLVVAIVVGVLVALVALVGLFPNEPIRRSIEAKMNRSLKGYQAQIGRARFQPVGLSLTLDNLVIRQTAHPDPPILVVPKLHASVHWKELLVLKVVADFALDRPRAHVNVEQLRSEAADPTPVKQKGWQQAVEAIYPLKINLFRVNDGALTYIDEDPGKPLELTHLNLRASNIRNIHSRRQTYPSPIRGSAVVFKSGRAEIDGHADFLAEPYAGVRGKFRLTSIPLDDVRPVTNHWNVLVSGGTVSTSGEIEFAPGVRKLALPDISVERLKIGYARRPPARAEKGLVPAAKKEASEPEVPWSLRLDRFHMKDSVLELVDETHRPAYRLFVAGVNADVEGLASEPPGRTARAKLRGKFMGSGNVDASATFRPGVRNADFDMKVAVGGTPMTKLNDLFRAYGKFDVASGTFELYSEVGVHDAYMRGYVKPIFQDIQIYDPQQEKGKSLPKKIYEAAVDAASKILKNRKHDQVATDVSIEGPVGNAKSNLFDVLGGLLENAFIRAILPGFDRQVGTHKG